MKNAFRTTAIAVGLATMISAGAMAQGMGGGKMDRGSTGGKGKMAPLMSAVFMKALERPEFVQSIGLSDGQVTKLKSLGEEMKNDTQKSRAALAPLEKELQAMMEQDKPDIAKVEALIEKIGGLRTDMQKTSVRTMLEMKATLTAEQIAAIKEQAKRFADSKKGKKGMKGRMGRGGGARGGNDSEADDSSGF